MLRRRNLSEGRGCLLPIVEIKRQRRLRIGRVEVANYIECFGATTPAACLQIP